MIIDFEEHDEDEDFLVGHHDHLSEKVGSIRQGHGLFFTIDSLQSHPFIEIRGEMLNLSPRAGAGCQACPRK